MSGLAALPILEDVAKAAHLIVHGNQLYLQSMAQSWANRDYFDGQWTPLNEIGKRLAHGERSGSHCP